MIIDRPRDCHIPQLRALWKEAFGDTDAFLDGFFQVGFSPERSLCLWERDRLSAALYWFDCTWKGKKIAYIYGVATDPAFRGKGFCRHLMEDTHDLLKAQGYHGSILVPGSEGLFSLYRKIGYVPCCGKTVQTDLPSGEPAVLTGITVEAYAGLQKQYLPEDSVFHDQVALQFAATYTQFYKGEGFAFCGGMEGETFYFQEFLGDTKKLPAILAALQAGHGQVRIFGDVPFAMYLPLDGETDLPCYFDIPLN